MFEVVYLRETFWRLEVYRTSSLSWLCRLGEGTEHFWHIERRAAPRRSSCKQKRSFEFGGSQPPELLVDLLIFYIVPPPAATHLAWILTGPLLLWMFYTYIICGPVPFWSDYGPRSQSLIPTAWEGANRWQLQAHILGSCDMSPCSSSVNNRDTACHATWMSLPGCRSLFIT